MTFLPRLCPVGLRACSAAFLLGATLAVAPAARAATETRPVGPFEAVAVAGPIDLQVSQGATASVQVDADADVLPTVETTVDDRRLTVEFQTCNLFALPSEREGFGLVFLEAMASGKPCLGARAGGIPEVITPDAGVLADYGDVPGIAAAALKALHHHWDQEDILARARHFSYSQFKAHLASFLSA